MYGDETELDEEPDDPGYLIATLAIADQVAGAVPAGMPQSWKRITHRAVLSAVLRDAVEHSTQRLEQDDVENLSRFVRNAARAASTTSLEHRDDAYEIVLGALLEDWVENWSSSGEDEDEPAAPRE